MELDAIDRHILIALQRDGRMQNIELAKKVGLSPSPCLRRVRLLEEAGVIERYVAVLNATKVGKGLTVFARVWLKGQHKFDTISPKFRFFGPGPPMNSTTCVSFSVWIKKCL